MTLLLLFPQKAAAWSELLVNGAVGSDSWSTIATLTKQDADGNSYSGTIDASSWTNGAQLLFKLYDSMDDGGKWWGNGGTADMTNNSTATLSNVVNTSGNNMTLKHSKSYSSYNINCTYSNGSWTIKITGEKSSTGGGGSSTTTTAADGYYLVTNFVGGTNGSTNADGNSINYNRTIFKFKEQEDGSYSFSIPASLTGHAQILGVSNGKATVYGPGSANYRIHAATSGSTGWPGTEASVSDALSPSTTLAEGSNYWSFETRNSNNGTSNDDGMYTISFTVTDGVPSKWTIEHVSTRRVAYVVNADMSEPVQPLYDHRPNSTSGFDDKFLGSVYIDPDKAYYVLGNYVINDSHIDNAKTLDGTVVDPGDESPTVNKLMLQGNGALEWEQSNDHNLVYPNKKTFNPTSTTKGVYILEYNPSKGKDGGTYGIGGELWLFSEAPKFNSVSMVGTTVDGTTTTSGSTTTWDYASTAGDMTYDKANHCYTLTLNTTAKDGATSFRFVANHSATTTWHEEDNTAANAARTPYDGSSTPGHTATVNDPNVVSYASTDDTGTTDVNIVFNRPGGNWTVKFYIEATNDNNNASYKYYYTIEGTATPVAIQIVGPAVVSGTNWTVDAQRNYTSTENVACGTWDESKAITLKPSDDGTYYYTTVTLKAGQKFRFIENNKYLTNFGEDDVTPSATDFAPATENGDVCYYNHISRNTLTADENPTGTSGESGLSIGKDITFTMPGLNAGDTYETEIRVSASNAFDQQMTGKAAPFYTITRPVKLFNYGSDGKGYTSFACNYPLEIVSGTDVKVYDITSYDKDKNKVTLSDKSSNYKTDTKQYIPAKSGVILSATASGNVSEITVRPMIEKLGETVDNGSNLLKAVYLPGTTINMTLPTEAKKTGDHVDSRQYLFSWVKQKNGSYKLGFLRSKTGVSVSERAYLSLTGEAVGATTLNPSDEAAYERVEGISTDDKTVFGAKEYQINLFFEGSDDDATTGIHTLNHQIADKEGYYTLQGIRVNKPIRAGIYIHNGKKIIVK